MASEQEFVRQLNLRNSFKQGSADWEKHNERVEAYAHYPFYALYQGDDNTDALENAEGTIEVLDRKDRAERQALIDADKVAQTPKKKKA